MPVPVMLNAAVIPIRRFGCISFGTFFPPNLLRDSVADGAFRIQPYIR